ncbi:MAG: energy-coupling factor transporter transmembrane protein EcfT [Clostridia bacterium]|nr:energy-coupling factor transporter transmembrane protein EcfT [Clostridia bacterium]MBO7296070.1 energy-coupling factor transporter transmembrane protein EcfT [Clostridia bacterium]
MKNVALGQYYPARSPLHKLDPRIKLILAMLYIVAAFLCKNLLGFGLLITSALLLIFISRVPLKTVLRSLRLIVFVLLFTVAINIFMTKDADTDPLFSYWIFEIYTKGLYSALFIAIRILCMIIGTCMLLTYTTTPIALTDALERLLSPLRYIKLPVHEFSMMMSIALRFIPTIMEEAEKIMAAQKARGAGFTEGNLIKRIKSLIPILIPLFASVFRRAFELATAMTCRCYRGGDGRTRMTSMRLRAYDVVMCILSIAFLAGIVSCNYWGIGYTL